MDYCLNWQNAVNHVLACYPEEGCGVITNDGEFIACKNIAEDPRNSFEIDPEIWLTYSIRCIVHSHTYDMKQHLDWDPRIPSKADQRGQINTDVEWCIVVCDGENVSDPIYWGDRSHRPPLKERPFIHGANDCLAYVTDWLFLEFGIDTPNEPRDYDWFMKGENLFEDFYESWGYVDVTHLPIKRGDVCFYKLESEVVNHIGVMVNETHMAHHLIGQIPRTIRASIYDKYCTRRVRHTSLME